MKVTVGIPAYNEEQNISALLKAILAQKLQNVSSLCQILVISDGSTDTTPDIISEWTKQDPRVRLCQLSKRLGKPTVINTIFRLAHGDVIVVIDADTMPIGDRFLSEITSPFMDNSQVGIIAAVGIPLPSRSLIGRAANFSANLRHRLILAMPYLAFNVAIAISTKTARTLELPPWIIGDDAYLYFKIKHQGLKTIISQNAKIFYREPQTLHDFVLQRKRYDINVIQLRQLFGNSVKKHLRIPRKFWGTFLREMPRDPIGGIVWLLLRGFASLQRVMESEKVITGVATSTKRGSSEINKK